jgi:hypothetical protein
MNSTGGDSTGEIVVQAAEREVAAASRSSKPAPRSDGTSVRAVGTREQSPLAREPAPPAVVPRGTRELAGEPDPTLAREPDPTLAREPAAPLTRPQAPRELDRDPVEVLRMWPHTGGMLEGGAVSSRARLPGPSGSCRFEDKIALAHLALDLYRELEEVPAAGRGAAPVQRAVPDTCDDRRCTARTNALRGALVEACLLVQRAALMTPEPIAADEVEDRLRDLLELVDH